MEINERHVLPYKFNQTLYAKAMSGALRQCLPPIKEHYSLAFVVGQNGGTMWSIIILPSAVNRCEVDRTRNYHVDMVGGCRRQPIAIKTN